MRRQLIVNADDLGRDEENVDAIVQALRKGIVTSASMFAAMPASAYAARRIREGGVLSFGVHLSFSCGTPLAPRARIASLIDPGSGGFHTPAALAGLVHTLDPEELKREFAAQIRSVQEMGITISHLDNHRHEVYMSGALFQATIDLAAEHSLPLRMPFDDAAHENAEVLSKRLCLSREEFVQLLTRIRQHAAMRGARHPDRFLSMREQDTSLEGFRRLLAGLGEGVSELSTHPGVESKRHLAELAILTDPEVARVVEREGVSLISFAEMGVRRS